MEARVLMYNIKEQAAREHCIINHYKEMAMTMPGLTSLLATQKLVVKGSCH